MRLVRDKDGVIVAVRGDEASRWNRSDATVGDNDNVLMLRADKDSIPMVTFTPASFSQGCQEVS